MNYPVDVIIYLNKFKESFMTNVYLDMLEDYGIPLDLKDKFDEAFLNEISKVSNQNFEDMGLAEVSLDQIDDALGLTVVEFHLTKMKNLGLIEEVNLPDSDEPGYQLTNKGHITNLTNNISLN